MSVCMREGRTRRERDRESIDKSCITDIKLCMDYGRIFVVAQLPTILYDDRGVCRVERDCSRSFTSSQVHVERHGRHVSSECGGHILTLGGCSIGESEIH